MKEITSQDRWRYQFDNFMSKGPIAMIFGLGVLSLLLIFVVAVFVAVTGIAPAGDDGTTPGLIQIAWMNLMRTLDAGTMGGDAGGWPYLFAMLFVTMGGVFIVSTFIGVLTSGIESRLEALRKGRSFVVEKNHTVIYGWSEQVFSIVSELIEANANKKRACIAILADKDKVEMEDEIAAKIPDTKTTRVVCRSGSPIDLADIGLVNPHDARSIVILGPETSDPDIHVIKTILALTNGPERKSESYHIVAEIRDAKNMAAAKLVGKDEATLVQVGELVSRIMVQTCRQSGLSVIYTELLDFGGDEIYFSEEPKLTGKKFSDVISAYENSAIMGLRFADGRIAVNPPMETVISAGDKVIAISEDDDTIQLSGKSDFGVDVGAIRESKPRQKTPEDTLILGWNARGCVIINELDSYVASGSTVVVVTDNEAVEEQLQARCKTLKNIKVTLKDGDITDRETLESLNVVDFEHVITLSDEDRLGAQESDAKTLVTLLNLREMADKGGRAFSIVSEMLDVRNRELAQVTRADDFIVSDKLIALMLSQLSENRELHAVFTDLFDPDGSEIYLKPVSDYVATGVDVNFYTLLEAAKRRGEIAIGYKIKSLANDAAKAFGVKVNPKKSEKIRFAEGDKIVVLAED